MGALAAKYPLAKVAGLLAKQPQSHPRTSPQGSPSPETPCDPAPDSSGACADACEQMVETELPPAHLRDPRASPAILTTLPQRDNVPLGRSMGTTARGPLGSPSSVESQPLTLSTCLPSRPIGTLPSGSTESSSPGGPIFETLTGTLMGSTEGAALAPPISSVGSTAVMPATNLIASDREPHSHQTHLFAAASLREALNVGGSAGTYAGPADSATVTTWLPIV